MAESVVLGLIGKQDLNIGTGTFTVTLPDGSTGTLNQISLSTFGTNVCGSAIFLSGPTVAVTFSVAELDANYFPTCTGNTQEIFWITSIATTGFTVNSSNGSSTATVYWHVMR